jgi:peptidoglycan hydrolase CwlO-like protein
MDAIYLEREAFKVDQASLKEEVSTTTSSLEKMADNIITVRQDMKNMSARFRSDIADLKQLILNMSANKRGCKQSKSSEGSSMSSAEKRADKSMETYDDIDHDMETSWTNMCESDGEGDTSDQNNVSQGCSKPIQGEDGEN